MKIKQDKCNIIYNNKKIVSFNIYLYAIFFIYLIPSYLSTKKIYPLRQLIFDNEITIKIKGNGTQFIVYEWGPTIPNIVYINGELQTTASKSYNMPKEENIIRMIWNNPISNCGQLFAWMTKIVEVDLSKFDTSFVTNMGAMFRGCSSLTSIKIGNIDTSLVQSMGLMFSGCSSLTSLNLNNLNTSSVVSMENMFYECTNLKELHIDNFNTEKTTSFNCMFFHCYSLTTLDLSSFQTSSATNMANMFENCKSLISLNVENFDTSNVENINLMFFGCSSLISLNLNSFNTSKANSPHDTFTNVGSQLIFCGDISKLQTIKNDISSFTNNCEDTCFSGNNTKLIIDKKQCTFDCQNDETHLYEYNNLCFNKCPEGTHALPNNIFLCLNIQEGVFLDENDEFQSCYSKCLYCNKQGDNETHNCLECIPGYTFLNDTNLETNCYEECSFYYYFDSDNNYHCTSNNICPDNYKKINEKNKCIDICQKDDTYKYDFNNTCYLSCPNGTYIESNGSYLCYEKLEVSTNKVSNDNVNKETEYNSHIEYRSDTSIDINTHNNNENTEKQDTISEHSNDNNISDNDNNSDNYNNSDNDNNSDNNDSNSDEDNSCYTLCKSCNEPGNTINNNCEECITNYILIKTPQNYNNCYKKCDFYYYFDDSNDYHCTDSNICPPEQNKLIKNKNKCIRNCSEDDTYIYEEKNICVKFISEDGNILICPLNLPFEKSHECVEICTSEEFLNKECKLNNKNNQTAQDNIIQSIKTDLSSGNLMSILSNVINGSKEDFILDDKDAIYQITSSDNQNNNEHENISSILLGDCETKLKQENNINEDESLIIFKIDILEEGLNIPIIEYEVYHPITLQKLELDCCKNTKIGISIPVTINENSLFKYNSSDAYYNDICYSYGENGIDLVIKDRQNEYRDKNYSLCESSCDYTNYNNTNKRALCKCDPKGTFTSVSKIKGNKNKLLTSFKDLKNAINLEIMKCYNILLSKDGLINNIGSSILLVIIAIHIICIFCFIIKGYNIIYVSVNNLANNLIEMNNIKGKIDKSNKIIKNNIKNTKYKTNKKYKKEKIKKENKNNKIKRINRNSCSTKNLSSLDFKEKSKRESIKSKTSKKIKTIRVHNPTNKRRKTKIKTKIFPEDYSSKGNTNTKTNLKDLKYLYGKKSCRNSTNKFSIFKNKDSSKAILGYKSFKLTFLNINDYELNNLLYNEAIELDKRTYCQYYWSLLKLKHLLIFTFYTFNDYNSKIIKVCLFFFSFSLYYTINALFFNYKTMHKIYEDQGSFNFIFQVPQILYSTLISSFINMIIKTLSLSQKNIIELKNHKQNLNNKKTNILKCLVIKFTLFFILSLILLLFFWFYLGCFCAVYKNTQKHLINDTIISFILSLLYPVFLNFIPGFFRIPSLRDVNKNKEGLYKFSKIIQLI